MPTFDIKGKKGVNVLKADAKHIKTSMFSCMLNTNYKPRSREEREQMGDAYPDILQELLTSHPQLFQQCVVVVDNIKTLPDNRKTFDVHSISSEDFEKDIKHIRSRFHCEVGNTRGKGERFHLHASFFIVHTTKIQFDLGPLVTELNKVLTDRNLPLIKYFHVSSEKPSTDLYMSKYNYV
jgi:hypothetical protein